MAEKTVSVDRSLPMPADILLPHRPPMLFVDSLLERYGDKAKGGAVMPDRGICYYPGYIFYEFFIEVVAQTMAMANGYDSLCDGREANDGMLVGIDSFVFRDTAPPGTRLHIIVEKTFELGAIKIVHGEVFHGSALLAQGDIKVWEDLG